MTYATQAQLSDRYGDKMLIQLTDRATPAAGAIDTDVIDRALADADAQIDGYLATRYQLPLTSTPALIVDLAQAIAVYKLHRHEPNEKIRKDYDDAVRTLKDISKGDVRLDVAGAAPDDIGDGEVLFEECERPFTPDKMKGFI